MNNTMNMHMVTALQLRTRWARAAPLEREALLLAMRQFGADF
jgi:hypothetical protein